VIPELPLGPKKIAYLGTPDIAVAPLKSLHQLGLDISIVVTGEDKRRGRGGKTAPSPVKVESERLGLSVVHDLASLSSVNVDLGVVVAFGQIIPESILKRVPMVNLHFSLLPKWRGAAPVERAILAGESLTGVCIMRVEKDLDTGGIYRKEIIPLDADKPLNVIRNELCEKGTELLVDCFRTGFGTPLPQSGEASYANKIKPDEHRIRWSQSAEEIGRVIRLENAWTLLNGKRLHILEAKIDMTGRQEPGLLKGTHVGTGKGNLDLITVKPEGRKEISAKDWINGIRISVDTRLGE
jgi:methionyl-tRNA formyltransferase|tara:strand:+ start:137016 stop:137903 length:888 start_codon:yes stop_codon:yes gene_type:complete